MAVLEYLHRNKTYLASLLFLVLAGHEFRTGNASAGYSALCSGIVMLCFRHDFEPPCITSNHD